MQLSVTIIEQKERQARFNILHIQDIALRQTYQPKGKRMDSQLDEKFKRMLISNMSMFLNKSNHTRMDFTYHLDEIRTGEKGLLLTK